VIALTYEGRLPGMNEIVAASKAHHQAYAKMKRTYTGELVFCIQESRRPQYPKVAVMVDWFEPNAKRDPDNIMAGQKFIFDALVHKGIIADDDQKHVASITHRFHVDATNPRVVVEVYEI
jgi:Holliday junction resolvase RusA-like endonuclease